MQNPTEAGQQKVPDLQSSPDVKQPLEPAGSRRKAVALGVRGGLASAWIIVRVYVPVALLVHWLEPTGVVPVLARVFEPLMALAWLPGEAALVFVTGAVTNLYGALAVAFPLASGGQLSPHDVTVLGVMCGICHSLPVETAVFRAMGGATAGNALFRLLVALPAGALVSWLAPADLRGEVLWRGAGASNFYAGLFKSVALIVALVVAMLVAYEWMRRWRWMGAFGALGRPLHAAFGMGRGALLPFAIGLLMGVSYGAGLMIRLREHGAIGRKDCILLASFLSVFHACIEDVLIFALLGGSFAWIFCARLLLASVYVFMISRAAVFERLFAARLEQARG